MNVNTNYFNAGRFGLTTYGARQAATLTEYAEPGIVKNVRTVQPDDVHEVITLLQNAAWETLAATFPTE